MDSTFQIEPMANMHAVIRDEDGNVVGERHAKNLFVTAGRNIIVDTLAGDLTLLTTGEASHLAVGTGTTAVTAADTALGTEVERDTVTKVTKTDGQLVIQYFLGTTQANGNTLTEAGLFNANSGGDMFARVLYSGIAKTASISITYTWTITLAAS